ncbi:ABC transporter substrate-binding protein [Acidobacteria bacterium AH-259-D05]|nr:ABC transporter substrate-binding protein [Acidobacteria bacterium AH-259-D05]
MGRANRSQLSDRVILATTDHVVRWHIVAREGINTLQDLKGKRIGYSGVGACSHYIALLLAQRMGWDPVQDLALLGGDYSVNPLKKGWVDAFIAYEIPFAMARSAGYKPMADLRSWNEPIPCSGVNASRSWAHNNRDTVLRFLKALTEAISLMKKDKYVAFKAMAKWYRITDSEIQQIIYDGAVEMPRKPYPAVDGIKKTMELYDSAQMRRFKPEDFYDDSFMKELDESGFIDRLYSQPQR